MRKDIVSNFSIWGIQNVEGKGEENNFEFYSSYTISVASPTNLRFTISSSSLVIAEQLQVKASIKIKIYAP
jgi:hypothetical protein